MCGELGRRLRLPKGECCRRPMLRKSSARTTGEVPEGHIGTAGVFAHRRKPRPFITPGRWQRVELICDGNAINVLIGGQPFTAYYFGPEAPKP